MERHEDIRHYIDIIRRRKYVFILPTIVSFLIFVIIVLRIPSMYKSTGTILIETSNLSGELVQPISTDFLERRLAELWRTTFNNERLCEIIQRLALYPELQDEMDEAGLVKKMRSAISMQTIRTDVFEKGRPGSVTSAFSLSFEGQHAESVQKATEALVSLLLSENIKLRDEKLQTTLAFFEKQKTDLHAELIAIETRLSNFKEKYQERLPETMQTNLRVIAELQKDIAVKEKDVEHLSASISDVKVKLSMTPETIEVKNGPVLTASQELEQLRRQYTGAIATLSSNHPDVIKLKNRLSALEEGLKTRGEFGELRLKFEQVELELLQAKQRYSERHPDVIKLEKEAQQIKRELQNYSYDAAVADSQPFQEENPIYVRLQVDLGEAENNLQQQKDALALLKQRLLTYEERTKSAPQIELEYQTLLREYENAKQRYREIDSRLLAAKEAKGIEESQLAERLTLVEPPVLPGRPERPNRRMLIALSLVFSMLLGVGLLTIVEAVDQRVYSARDVEKIGIIPVLSEIPHITTRPERLKRGVVLSVVLLGCIGVLAVALTTIHFYIAPLDSVSLMFMERLQEVL